MSLAALLDQIHQHPKSVQFDAVMAAIADHYVYAPTAFKNGDLHNAAGQNEGSCKLFAFAQLNGLDQLQTLACFGNYYRLDVLGHPDGSDHGNIRNFMVHGWDGIRFDGTPLEPKPGL